MAVFETEITSKITLDDTDKLSISIINNQTIDSHVEYVIRVHRHCADTKWNISHRYNDFLRLNSYLSCAKLSNLQLPPKKLLGNLDKNFIIQRQTALQEYLERILSSPLCNSIYVKKFLDPRNYSECSNDEASQHVAMALRSSNLRFEVIKYIENMGWRIRKHYYTVRDSNIIDKTEQSILTWSFYGPDQYLDHKHLSKLFSLLSNLQHLENSKFHFIGESGGAIVRKLNNEGTLKDLIHNTKPYENWISKLSSNEYKPFSEHDIARIGAKILDTLIFLSEKGIHHGHIHPGNILIRNDGSITILDIENGLLGLPCIYRSLIVQLRKVYSAESIDVYCFGHTLYEMTFSTPLTTATIDEIPPQGFRCSQLLWSLLLKLLGNASCKNGLPTLYQIRSDQFFNGISKLSFNNTTLHISIQLQQALKDSYMKAELRLKEDQKKIRREKRQEKVQKHLIEEEQKQKLQRKTNKMNRKVTTNNTSVVLNGKSPERSDSPTSTNTSAGTLTPPPVATSSNGSSNDGLSALLGSICNFDKAALRPTKTPR